MAHPSMYEWCAAYFNSLQNNISDMMGYQKEEEKAAEQQKRINDLSPMLSSIQSIKGATSQEKMRSLNDEIRKIAKKFNGRSLYENAITFEDSTIHKSIVEVILATIGRDKKLKKLIEQSLKSEIDRVVDIALRANWYFDPVKNSDFNPSFFLTNVMPHVTIRARDKVIKKIGSRLNDRNEKLAQEFFTQFVEHYPVDHCLPILASCSTTFVSHVIKKYKLILSEKFVDAIYHRHENAVVEYLKLSKRTDVADPNSKERKSTVTVNINDYQNFLHKLIKKQPKLFVELYRLTPGKMLKLSKKRTRIFYKNSKDEILQNPDLLLKLLDADGLISLLENSDFETIFTNLFPKSIKDLNFEFVLRFLDRYKLDKIELLSKNLQSKYNVQLYENLPVEHLWSFLIHKPSILPLEQLSKRVQWFFKKNPAYSKDDYYQYLCVEEILKIVEERKKSSKKAKIDEDKFLIRMSLLSCAFYENAEGLSKLLKLYKERADNESCESLNWFLDSLGRTFTYEALNDEHYSLLEDIAFEIATKEEQLTDKVSLNEGFLKSAIRHSAAIIKDEKRLEKALTYMAKTRANRPRPTSFLDPFEDSSVEKRCVDKFLNIFEKSYPHDGSKFWKNEDNKLIALRSFLRTVQDYHERLIDRTKKSQKSTPEKLKISIEQQYPWILKLSEELFNETEPLFRRKELLQLLKITCPNFYENKVDKLSTRYIGNGDALKLLRTNAKVVLDNWSSYYKKSRSKVYNALYEKRPSAEYARSDLQAIRFVRSLKWCDKLPIKFVEESANRIEEPGSVEILGILLEGEAFEKIVEDYLPAATGGKLRAMDEVKRGRIVRSILTACKFLQTPCSLRFLEKFLTDEYKSCVAIAEGAITKTCHRSSADKVWEFARRLFSQESPTVKKIGLTLARTFGAKKDLKSFLDEVTSEPISDPKIRSTLEKIANREFSTRNSTSEAHQLENSGKILKTSVQMLTVDDLRSIEALSKIDRLDPTLLSSYLEEYLKKMDELVKTGLNINFRNRILCGLFESLSANSFVYLRDELCCHVLERYFIDETSWEVSRSAQRFASKYLTTSGYNLESNLNHFARIMKKILQRYDACHLKYPRSKPVNCSLRRFVDDVLTDLSSSGYVAGEKRIIERLVGLIEDDLSPIKASYSYVALRFYLVYLEAQSPRDFGARLSDLIPSLIETFSVGDLALDEMSSVAEDMIFNKKIFKKSNDPLKVKLEIISGLLQEDEHYSCLLSVYLLNASEVFLYGEIYDSVVKRLSLKRNASIQLKLHRHVNAIAHFDYRKRQVFA